MPINNERQQFVHEDQMLEIVAKLRKPHRQDFVRFAFYTGKRPGSIRQLKWDDVDFDDRMIRFRAETIKTRQYEQFPIYRQVHEILDRRLAASWGELVFHKNGREVKEFSAPFRLAAAEAGYPGIQIRDMRSSFITLCALQGVPLKTTMKLSGHRTIRMATRYHKVAGPELREAVDVLEKALGEMTVPDNILRIPPTEK